MSRMSTNQINGFLLFSFLSFLFGVRPVLLLVATIDHCQTRTTGKKLTRFYTTTDTPTSPDGLTNRPAEVLSYDQKVSLLGRPKLGENTRLQIRVKESKEFKVVHSIDLACI